MLICPGASMRAIATERIVLAHLALELKAIAYRLQPWPPPQQGDRLGAVLAAESDRTHCKWPRIVVATMLQPEWDVFFYFLVSLELPLRPVVSC